MVKCRLTRTAPLISPSVGVGDFSVWEFSGNPVYYCSYDYFAANDATAIHLVLFSLEEPYETQLGHITYWLNLLKALNLPQDNIGDAWFLLCCILSETWQNFQSAWVQVQLKCKTCLTARFPVCLQLSGVGSSSLCWSSWWRRMLTSLTSPELSLESSRTTRRKCFWRKSETGWDQSTHRMWKLFCQFSSWITVSSLSNDIDIYFF